MKKNLILISLDCVRADVGYSGQFSAIENVRQSGVSLLNTISSAPLTPVSHASVMTGLHPYNHGVRHLFKEKLNSKATTLASILKKHGYDTGAVVSCPGMNSWYKLNLGFEHYDDEIPKLADGTDPLKTVDVKLRGTALKRAPLVVSRSMDWLDNHSARKPFFLFMHFFDAHWPYEAPEKFYGNNKYEEEIAFTSHYLDDFLLKIEKRGLLDNTTIVVFSDHGEDLDGWYPNDKGGQKLGHPEESGHGCLLYDQTIKTLMIFKDKSLPQNKNIDKQARLIDLLPTTLGLLDVKEDGLKLDGVDLFNDARKDDIELLGYSETCYPSEQNLATGNKYPEAKDKTAIRFSDKKVILHDAKITEYYHLKNDVNEINNLIRD